MPTPNSDTVCELAGVLVPYPEARVSAENSIYILHSASRFFRATRPPRFCEANRVTVIQLTSARSGGCPESLLPSQYLSCLGGVAFYDHWFVQLKRSLQPHSDGFEAYINYSAIDCMPSPNVSTNLLEFEIGFGTFPKTLRKPRTRTKYVCPPQDMPAPFRLRVHYPFP